MEIIRIGAMFHALSLLRPCSPARFCRLERFRFPRISKLRPAITRWLNVIVTTETILTALNSFATFQCLFKASPFYETLLPAIVVYTCL